MKEDLVLWEIELVFSLLNTWYFKLWNLYFLKRIKDKSLLNDIIFE